MPWPGRQSCAFLRLVYHDTKATVQTRFRTKSELMSNPSSPAVSVVIPHYNDVVRLTRCLEALMNQVGDDVQIIVADNGSEQDLAPVKARWPDVEVVTQPEKGAGPARNAGAAVAAGTWLAFLDADCVPDPDWLAVAREVMTEGAVFGGQVRVFHETSPPQSGAEAFETVFAFRVASYLDKGFLPSCQLVMFRADFEAVGGFRRDVSEDVDWSRRATSAGLRLALCDELKIAHPSRSDWPALLRKWRRLTSEGFLLEGQGVRGRILWILKALLMPASALVHTRKILTQPDLTLGEKGRGLATLFRLRLVRMVWMMRQSVTGQA